MASEIATPLSRPDAMDPSYEAASYERPEDITPTSLANVSATSNMQHGDSADAAITNETSQIPPPEATTETNETVPSIPDRTMAAPTLADDPAPVDVTPSVDHPAPAVDDAPPLLDPAPPSPLRDPAPIQDVATGIAPVADFIPKDAANLSHPTPPPDEPLGSGTADVDMGGNEDQQVSNEPAPIPAQIEQVLVRPREDDEDDERAAKRSKLDVDAPADVVMTDEPALADPVVLKVDNEPIDEDAKAVDSFDAQLPAAPAAESVTDPIAASESADLKVEPPQADPVPPFDAPTESVEAADATTLAVEEPPEEDPAESQPAAAQPTADAPSQPAQTSATQTTYSSEPLTNPQKSFLLEKMKNLKKTKNSVAFLKPVDPVALNIPSYLETIKTPMDLGTMDNKLKDGQYGSVQDFVNDFELIVNNTVRFNGPNHAVSVAGQSMEAYFRRMMESVPSTDMPAPAKLPKKRSPSLPREKRRESRSAAAPVAPAAPAAPVAPAAAAPAPNAPSFALQSDGTPQIRRQSTIDRPARAIKPPANREIAYAKPKRKEHAVELKFCDHVLDEIRSPRLGTVNHVFQMPVDPVALNIPHYRNIVKVPMDLGTMAMKLKGGQYATAVEFKKDFDLMIRNCLAFNPIGNPVRDLGIQLQREFEALWANKEKWERKNQPASARASSASADDDSGADDEDEEDEEEATVLKQEATIKELQRQLAAMQNALSGLGGEKLTKAKKPKSSSKIGGGKKTGASAGPTTTTKSKPASKPKPKKPRLVTYDEKQEISEAVGKMTDAQSSGLTDIIVKNCKKYRDMEEMELEIDELPNDVQLMLLEYVRKIFGNPTAIKKKAAAAREPSPDDAAAVDDDDFEPDHRGGRGGGGKRKKHRPMGKKEQQDAINSIKSQLAQFAQPSGTGTSGSESPTSSSFAVANARLDADAETSGDEDSEESEEE